MNEERTEVYDRFMKDVSEHRMTVLKDDGFYRHLRFSRCQTSAYRFDLVTWPGFLAVTGDMGEYVFTRLKDMFEFFRTDQQYAESLDKTHLAINPSYWAEKCQAADRHGKIEEFSPDLFRSAITEQMEAFIESWYEDDDEETKQDIREHVEEFVLDRADDGEGDAMHAAMNFEYGDRYPFADFFETNCHAYTFHYLWICFAIQWGIKQYDQATKP